MIIHIKATEIGDVDMIFLYIEKKFPIYLYQNQSMTEKERAAIPSAIKRNVRQRCGFGCVICGFPLCDYEHMEEWSKVKRHKVEELTLLCTQHHREKTSKLLPAYIVKEANKSPFNLRNGISTPYNLFYEGNNAEVNIGGVGFICKDDGNGAQMIPLITNNIPNISIILSDGHYLLDINLFDKDNNPVLIISENALKYSVGVWDIEFVGRTLTMREGAYKIFIEIEFETPNKVNIKRGKIYCNGKILTVSENKGIVYDNREARVYFSVGPGIKMEADIGIAIGENTTGLRGIIKL